MYDQRLKSYELCVVAMLTQHLDILVKKRPIIELILVNKGKENKIGTSQQTNKQDGKGRHDKRSLSFAAMKDAKRRKRQQCTWMKKAINSEGMYTLHALLHY